MKTIDLKKVLYLEGLDKWNRLWIAVYALPPASLRPLVEWVRTQYSLRAMPGNAPRDLLDSHHRWIKIAESRFDIEFARKHAYEALEMAIDVIGEESLCEQLITMHGAKDDSIGY